MINMKIPFFAFIAFFNVFFFTPQLPAAQLTHHVPGELLVKFKAGQPGASNKPQSSFIKQKAATYHLKKRKAITGTGVEHWTLNNSDDLGNAIARLQADPDVLVVEPNYRRYPRTSHFITATRAKQLSDATLSQINLDSLPAMTVTPTRLPVVAVFDDAFDIKHDDLADNVFNPYNAVEKNADPAPTICHDSISNEVVPELHGTMVMGVVGAVVDNGIGINGASDNSKIMPVRLGCNYSVAAELEAIAWAKEKGADIINMSYGGPQFSVLERLAVVDLISRNTLLVIAAGNVEMDNDRIPDYPSGLNLPNIIAVAALDFDNNLTRWTQFGQTSVDIAAPGEREMFGTTAASQESPSRYSIIGGTSFSAPLVSGVVATLMMRYPDASIYDVKGAIMGSAVPFGDSQTGSTQKASLATDGRVDALAAFDLLSASPKPVPVIRNFYIDDQAGNKNALVDEGETVDLVITIENIWADADSLAVTLRSPDIEISPMTQDIAAGIKGYDAQVQNYGDVTVRFSVFLGSRMQMQDLLFTLDLTGTYASASKKFTYQRAFRVNTGSLTIGKPVQATLKTNDRDEVHYYYVFIPERKDELIFNLAMRSNIPFTNADRNANLLVKFGGLPQFDYAGYETAATSLVDEGTLVSANGGLLPEQIIIKNAAAGTYHIAVVSSSGTSSNNIAYSLGVDASVTQFYQPVVSGCVMAGVGRPQHFDPMLPLLIILSLFSLSGRFKQPS